MRSAGPTVCAAMLCPNPNPNPKKLGNQLVPLCVLPCVLLAVATNYTFLPPTPTQAEKPIARSPDSALQQNSKAINQKTFLLTVFGKGGDADKRRIYKDKGDSRKCHQSTENLFSEAQKYRQGCHSVSSFSEISPRPRKKMGKTYDCVFFMTAKNDNNQLRLQMNRHNKKTFTSFKRTLPISLVVVVWA